MTTKMTTNKKKSSNKLSVTSRKEIIKWLRNTNIKEQISILISMRNEDSDSEIEAFSDIKFHPEFKENLIQFINGIKSNDGLWKYISENLETLEITDFSLSSVDDDIKFNLKKIIHHEEETEEIMLLENIEFNLTNIDSEILNFFETSSISNFKLLLIIKITENLFSKLVNDKNAEDFVNFCEYLNNDYSGIKELKERELMNNIHTMGIFKSFLKSGKDSFDFIKQYLTGVKKPIYLISPKGEKLAIKSLNEDITNKSFDDMQLNMSDLYFFEETESEIRLLVIPFYILHGKYVWISNDKNTGFTLELHSIQNFRLIHNFKTLVTKISLI